MPELEVDIVPAGQATAAESRIDVGAAKVAAREQLAAAMLRDELAGDAGTNCLIATCAVELSMQNRTLTHDHSRISRPRGRDIGRKVGLRTRPRMPVRSTSRTFFELLGLAGVSVRLRGVSAQGTHTRGQELVCRIVTFVGN